MFVGVNGDCTIQIKNNEFILYKNKTYLPADSPITVKAGDQYFVIDTDFGLETGKECLGR